MTSRSSTNSRFTFSSYSFSFSVGLSKTWQTKSLTQSLLSAWYIASNNGPKSLAVWISRLLKRTKNIFVKRRFSKNGNWPFPASIYLFLPFQCSFVVNLPMFGFELVLEATALPTELQPMPNFFWDRLLFVSKSFWEERISEPIIDAKQKNKNKNWHSYIEFVSMFVYSWNKQILTRY